MVVVTLSEMTFAKFLAVWLMLGKHVFCSCGGSTFTQKMKKEGEGVAQTQTPPQLLGMMGMLNVLSSSSSVIQDPAPSLWEFHDALDKFLVS